MKKNTLFFVGLLLLWPDHAQAYFDPGTGSMIIQFLVGGLAAGWILFRTQWDRVRRFFQKRGADKGAEG